MKLSFTNLIIGASDSLDLEKITAGQASYYWEAAPNFLLLWPSLPAVCTPILLYQPKASSCCNTDLNLFYSIQNNMVHWMLQLKEIMTGGERRVQSSNNLTTVVTSLWTHTQVLATFLVTYFKEMKMTNIRLQLNPVFPSQNIWLKEHLSISIVSMQQAFQSFWMCILLIAFKIN